MIGLNIQIKLIIFSFIFGFMFSILLDWFNEKCKIFHSLIKLLFSIILISIMTYIYFVGIQKIGNAIFHFYSILSIIIGFYVYNILIRLIANNKKK